MWKFPHPFDPRWKAQSGDPIFTQLREDRNCRDTNCLALFVEVQTVTWQGGSFTPVSGKGLGDKHIPKKVKIEGPQIPKGRLVKGPYKSICRDCAIYFSTTVPGDSSEATFLSPTVVGGHPNQPLISGHVNSASQHCTNSQNCQANVFSTHGWKQTSTFLIPLGDPITSWKWEMEPI